MLPRPSVMIVSTAVTATKMAIRTVMIRLIVDIATLHYTIRRWDIYRVNIYMSGAESMRV